MGRRLNAEERLLFHQGNQRWHFKKRVRQRFGLEILDHDIDWMVQRIKEDKPGVLFLALRRRSSAWRLRWRKQTMVVIYDHRTEQLVTAFQYKRWKWE
ncbi:hypothetical protein [Horticoccus sp. 23ND18S-11]|uniref:hypothetical protein n=1 Tax=Horticoccus sp. 23ND18S-11 TaxID=3391832 RepID=UPI0039C91926